MPHSRGSAPIVHVPVAELQSTAVPTPNAQQLEITLRERLQQQRRSSILLNNPPQQERSIESGSLPTPPSTTHSDRFSSIDATEIPATRNESDQMICDDMTPSKEGSTDRIVQRETPEPRGRTTNMPNTQVPVLSHTRRREYSRSPSESRSRSPSRALVNPKRSGLTTRGRTYRSSSRSTSPLGSFRHSPASRRSRSIGSEESRGRRMRSPELPRSPSSGRSIRDRPQLPQSRSRSNGRDSYMRSRPMSTSTTLYSDELAVERASSTQSSPSPPPIRVRRPSDSSGELGPVRNEVSKAGAKPSLHLRIGEEIASPIRPSPKHTRRRTCPFYHPTEQDKHPLNGPHPGYSVKEFDEAVNCYEQGGTLPGRLIKGGAMINLKNRPLRSPAKPLLRRSQTSQISLEQRVDGCVATSSRSRSPMEPAAKRRRIVTQSFPSTPAPFVSNERGYGSYPSQPKATISHNVPPFRQRGPSSASYEAKRQTNYFQHNGIGGSPTLTRPQKPAYGRRFYSQESNMEYYRSQ